ncbi:MAG: glutamate-5-semialdehyde dehydrogenase [Chloroflexi bacterium]|nr:glutamate-5-semialdehyde dehydrogenase [Chloroflexota bacterium]
MKTLTTNLPELGQRARAAIRQLAVSSRRQRDTALLEIARRLEASGEVLTANAADVAQGRQDGLSAALLDRLTLTPKRIAAIAAGCRDVAALPDALGELIDGSQLPNGLRVSRRRVPIGVIAAIYESRPNVTIEISSLTLKTGNAVILRGGKETLRTNVVLGELVRAACEAAGLPADAVQLITDPDRALVEELLGMDDVIDLVIPRGGQGLQNLVRKFARMPVVYGGIGVCHLFVDAAADLNASLKVIHNAKTQAPSVCNALDTVLVHSAIAEAFIPRLVTMFKESGVRMLLDKRSMTLVPEALAANNELLASATADDFGREFLSLVFSVRVVDSLDEAIAHIAQYSTQHSDGILTNDHANAACFTAEVDSAVVYVNASTRFTDGGQLGLGAEVAISTQRMHARGPLGLRELTTYKWIVEGDYHVRA